MFLKSRKICLLWICVFAMLSVWCTACGEEDAQGESEAGGYVYRGEWVSFPYAADKMRIMKVYGNSLYYIVIKNGVRAMYEAPLAGGIDTEGITEFIPNCDGEGEYLADYEITENGEYYCLLRKADSKGCVLVKRFQDGGAAYRLELPEVYGALDFDLGLAVDGEGYVYLLSADGIYQVDPEGGLCGSIATGSYRQGGMDQRLLKGEEGRIYYCAGYKLNSYTIYELMGGDMARLEKRTDSPEGDRCGKFYPSEYGLLCDGESALYQYKGDGWEKVLVWRESDIYRPRGGFCELAQIDGESFVLVGYSPEDYDEERVCCLRREAVSGLPEKEELVLVSIFPDSTLEQAVAGFNLESDRYRVTVETYEWGEVEMGLNPRLVSSDPPDLLDVSKLDILNYAQRSAFEDLVPYLEGSGVLDRDMFPENLLEGYTIDGRLVCIPRTFEIHAVAGRASRLGDGMGWTMEEVMGLTERYPGQRLALDTSAQFLVKELCGRYICQHYIDWNTGECRFEGDEFRAFLEWVGENADSVRTDNSQNDSYWDTERLLAREDMVFLGQCAKMAALFGEDVTFKGDPTDDGKAVFSARPKDALCILAGSEHKEGAWAFVEYLLSRESDGIPGRRDFLEDLIEAEMTPEYFMTDDGEIRMSGEEPDLKPKTVYNKVPFYYMTQEQADMVREIVEAVDFTPAGGLRDTVTDIILDEIGGYMEGTRGVEDTARIIQNRVRTVVQENR